MIKTKKLEFINEMNKEKPYKIKDVYEKCFIEQMIARQSLLGGVLGGLLAAIFCIVLWGITAAISGYQDGFAALAVGYLVGISVKKSGKGVDKQFGYVGALCTITACFVGSFLAASVLYFIKNDITFASILKVLNFESVLDIVQEAYSSIDLFFYAIATYEGYKLSFIEVKIKKEGR